MESEETLDNLYDIAVIGMAGRFPKAKNIEQFWENLKNGVEGISFFSDEELIASGISEETLKAPNYVKAKGWLDDIEMFDASFFGYSPKEAEIMDPQHRFLLEVAWEVLENAGYDPARYTGAIAVYAGLSTSSYILGLYSDPKLMESADIFQVSVGNDRDHAPTHVSYKFNLKGPSINVQTACSTSLVAVHLACQSLLTRQCDMAIVGGVSIGDLKKSGYWYTEGSIYSPDGHCRAFDEKGAGTLGGSGVGLVLLKRMQEALQDGDSIRAVIKGSAINNDGSLKVGYTAPSVEGQAEVIEEALAVAGVEPETVTYVEAHGTATNLGDPIEVAALTKSFRKSTDKKGFCGLGSVKSNIGHLDVAAGVTGLIKTILSLEKKMLPPSLHFQQPNSKIDFEHSPFYVNSSLKEWKRDIFPRRAGVSSFGIGGTNAHVIVEEAPEIRSSSSQRRLHILPISAKHPDALEQATSNLAAHLKVHKEQNLADVAHTLQVGRQAFRYRKYLLCSSTQEAISILEGAGQVFASSPKTVNPSTVFMFPGGSAQYVGMAKEIYQNEPVFRQSVDQCTEMLEPELGLNLCQFMYPSDEDIERAKQELKRTLYGLPALFIVEYALAKLWLSWGVKPEAMIGHSLGEYVAAHISGVFSLEDALKLVLLRGRLFERLPEGAMLSVALTEEEARQVPIEGLSIAAVNGSSLSVLSGAVDAIERAEKYLEKLEPKRLHISVAAHSAMVEPILDEFQAFFEKLSLSSPKIPFISNVTGSWIKDSEAVDPEYWRKHLRQTVKFAEGIEELLKGTGRIFLEVGPGTTLTTLSSQFLTQRQDSAAISSLPHHLDQRSDEEFLLNALGQLWLEGISIDWPKLYEGEKRLRLPLPTYPFQRQRYWVEPCEVEELERVSLQKSDKKRKLKSREELSNWFYLPNWKQTPLTTQPLNNPEILFLIFVDRLGFGDRVAESLEAQGYKTLLVKIGERFEQLDKRRYLIDPKSKQDYENLMQDSGLLKKSLRILHFWNVTEQAPSIEEAKWLGFYSMLFLAQAIGDGIEEAKIYLISNGLQAVSSEEVVHPSKATLLGSCKVIPQEYQNLKCSSIDITNFEDRFIEPLIDEFLSEEFGNEITYRAALRYQKTYEPFKIPETTNSKVLRYEGVYLITGGLGGIALTLAEYLARNLKAKLILVGRSSLPPKSLWQEQDYSKEQSEKIAKLKLLEELGAEVLALSADVADKEQMQEVLQQAKEQFGTINGVIHTAGVPVGGLVQLKTVEAADRVMRAKVDGTMVLDELLKDESIDFLLLCSSLNSILGGFGHVAYAAANAFLDSYAQSRNLKIGWTVSVNWDTWQEVGMAVRSDLPAEFRDFQKESLKQGILPHEGAEAFARILGVRVSQVAVATKDLAAQIEHEKNFQVIKSLQQLDKFVAYSKSKHARPQVSSEYVAPRSDTEKQLSELWQNALGIDRIGIHDNFFELGGNSLTAIQLLSRIRASFQTDVAMRDFFHSPKIISLAAIVTREKDSRTEQLEELLREIERLSDEQLDEALAKEQENSQSASHN